MATAQVLQLMSAEQFGRRPDPGFPEELVQGRVVSMPPPDRKHGYVCGQAYYFLRRFVDERELGRVMSNDSGVITQRDPDTVRGADIAFYSYSRLPRGPLPTGYGPELPELTVEVRSAHDHWSEILEKVAEYLRAGVLTVVVLDPEPQTAHVFCAQRRAEGARAGRRTRPSRDPRRIPCQGRSAFPVIRICCRIGLAGRITDRCQDFTQPSGVRFTSCPGACRGTLASIVRSHRRWIPERSALRRAGGIRGFSGRACTVRLRRLGRSCRSSPRRSASAAGVRGSILATSGRAEDCCRS